MTDLSPALEVAYRERYGADWFDCLSDSGTVRGLPTKNVLALVINRMVKLAARDEGRRGVVGEPVAWVSPRQLASHQDGGYETGLNLPVRKTPAGMFTQALFAAAPAPPVAAAPAPVEPRAEAKALADVATERKRQISAEGWSPEHDDEHNDGSLAKAAACYAVGYRIHASNGEDGLRPAWLWPRGWEFNPDDRRRELVKAGALIVAEIERLDRASSASLFTAPGEEKS